MENMATASESVEQILVHLRRGVTCHQFFTYDEDGCPELKAQIDAVPPGVRLSIYGCCIRSEFHTVPEMREFITRWDRNRRRRQRRTCLPLANRLPPTANDLP